MGSRTLVAAWLSAAAAISREQMQHLEQEGLIEPQLSRPGGRHRRGGGSTPSWLYRHGDNVSSDDGGAGSE